jgi:aspartyl-tRNA(Asn)/glutamyl-tRNA(Gln) amidotransferase subunit B
MGTYQSFIGLEIHVQLQTHSKIFCSCRAGFGDEPNTNVCPVCLGYPGTLPTLNIEAMRSAYTVARALGCTLAPETFFERKNYFYPDLPKNYQISQFQEPLGTDGHIDLELSSGVKRVGIKEVHLEEDAGKMIHVGDMSLLDYNRTGTPLLEIVTHPDLVVGEEAEALILELRRIVRYLGVSDGNMEEGSLRCDANVSVNTPGAGLGSKVEIKNMNSSRFVRKALDFEITRQGKVLQDGGIIPQETRLWNENRDLTETMRVKESSNDYRYFPEPDLPPFRADAEFLSSVEAKIVELPAARRHRFATEYGLDPVQVAFLCEERATADYFEEVVGAGSDPREVALWLSGDVQKQINRRGVDLVGGPLTAQRLAALLGLLAAERIHGKIAKQTLEAVFEEDKDPEIIITEKGWEKISDQGTIDALVDEVIAGHPEAVAQILDGDRKPLGFLIGQIMKASSGRAEPQAVQAALNKRLSEVER